MNNSVFNDDSSQKFLSMAVELGEAIKQIAPDVWQTFLYQQRLEAFTTIGGSVLAFILFLLAFYFGPKIWKYEPKWDKNSYDYAENKMLWYTLNKGIYGGGIGITLIVVICNTCNCLPKIINPEYYAIRDLVGTVR